jgi:hypothetical protein
MRCRRRVTDFLVGHVAGREAIQTDGGACNSQSPSRPRHVFDPQARAVLSCTLAVGAVVAAQGRTWWRRAFCIVGALSVGSPLPLISLDFVYPLPGHEAAENVRLLQTLQAVPRDLTCSHTAERFGA